jgi:hypothetical protein
MDDLVTLLWRYELFYRKVNGSSTNTFMKHIMCFHEMADILVNMNKFEDDSGVQPNDPIFWPMHATLDKLVFTYQSFHSPEKEPQTFWGYKNDLVPWKYQLNQSMSFIGGTYEDWVDLSKMKYTYEEDKIYQTAALWYNADTDTKMWLQRNRTHKAMVYDEYYETDGEYAGNLIDEDDYTETPTEGMQDIIDNWNFDFNMDEEGTTPKQMDRSQDKNRDDLEYGKIVEEISSHATLAEASADLSSSSSETSSETSSKDSTSSSNQDADADADDKDGDADDKDCDDDADDKNGQSVYSDIQADMYADTEEVVSE